jgi:hypothetical protein
MEKIFTRDYCFSFVSVCTEKNISFWFSHADRTKPLGISMQTEQNPFGLSMQTEQNPFGLSMRTE